MSVDLTLQLGSQGAQQVVDDFTKIGAAGKKAGEQIAKGGKKGEDGLKGTEGAAEGATEGLGGTEEQSKKTAKALGLTAEQARMLERSLKHVEGSAGKSRGSMQGLSNFANATGANLRQLASDALDLARAIGELATEGAQLNQISSAFAALGNTDATMQRLRDATKGLVDDSTLQRMQNLAQLFGINKDQVSQLAEVAVGASVATGQSVEKMFEDVLTAASRQSRMIADNLGIVISLSGAYEKQSAKLGKTVKQLTDEEKSYAFTQEMIARAGKQRSTTGTDIPPASVRIS